MRAVRIIEVIRVIRVQFRATSSSEAVSLCTMSLCNVEFVQARVCALRVCVVWSLCKLEFVQSHLTSSLRISTIRIVPFTQAKILVLGSHPLRCVALFHTFTPLTPNHSDIKCGQPARYWKASVCRSAPARSDTREKHEIVSLEMKS